MSAFAAEWLALREPADARGRSTALLERLAAQWPRGADGAIVDLGAGSGANFRYLAPRLGGQQRWVAVDDDPALLAALPDTLAAWASSAGARCTERGDALVVAGDGFDCTLRAARLDLSADLRRLAIGPGALVTGSALLDLVSERWLGELASCCAAAGAPVLFALTYDGRIGFEPRDAADERVRDAVNRHQLRDKGFGPALGPAAAATATAVFETAGYRVEHAPSDWVLGAGDADLQRALVTGWHGAAVEAEPGADDAFGAWMRRRLSLIDAGRSTLRVGHQDLVAFPRAAPDSDEASDPR